MKIYIFLSILCITPFAYSMSSKPTKKRAFLDLTATKRARTPAKKKITCSICLGDADEEKIETLPCSHFYHTSCIGEWFLRTNKCPECKDAGNRPLPIEPEIKSAIETLIESKFRAYNGYVSINELSIELILNGITPTPAIQICIQSYLKNRDTSDDHLFLIQEDDISTTSNIDEYDHCYDEYSENYDDYE